LETCAPTASPNGPRLGLASADCAHSARVTSPGKMHCAHCAKSA
jgi:hypothetical protein